MNTTFRVTTYDIVISTFPLYFQKHKELGTLNGDTLTLILKIFNPEYSRGTVWTN